MVMMMFCLTGFINYLTLQRLNVQLSRLVWTNTSSPDQSYKKNVVLFLKKNNLESLTGLTKQRQYQKIRSKINNDRRLERQLLQKKLAAITR